MLNFLQYLDEGTQLAALLNEAEGKRTHLTHLEDVVLDDGANGIKFALKTLREFGKILHGGSSKAYNVSVKWDGAPAIVFGLDPADGRFFVATKGAFSKSPKLGKSHADIDALYGAGPGAKLHVAFDALKDTRPKTVVQGDMLFTKDMLGAETIDGVSYLTFQPNTIMYAVDRASALGQRIAKADFGIVVHTMYQGKGDLANYSATACSPAVWASIRPSSKCVLLDAGYDDVSGTATFTTQEESDYTLALEAAEAAARGVHANVYATFTAEPLHGYIAQFVNSTVRQNTYGAGTLTAAGLAEFLLTLAEKEAAGRKTDSGKQAVRDKFNQYVAFLKTNAKGVNNLFACHQSLTDAKNLAVRKLGQAARVASFVPTGDGFRVTGPEGFVAVAHDGKAVKLVDRLEFSRLNFTQPKNWQRS